MSDTISFLRANPGLLAVSVLLTMGALVFGLIAIMMARSGASLKPIVFIGGFFAIVVLPQLLLHASQAFGWIPKRDLVWTFGKDAIPDPAGIRYRVKEDLLTIRDGVFVDAPQVFGPDADPSLTVDLRARMPDGPFATARAAQMAITGVGASITIALFDREAEAQRAAEQYASMMLGALPPVGADGTRTVTRTSDVVKLLVAGRTMLAWSAADSAAATRAMGASPVLVRDSSPATDTRDAEVYWLYRPVSLIAMTLFFVALAVLWFFKMSVWASQVGAVAGTTPVDGRTLRERLLSVNSLDIPFSVEADPHDSSRLVATWRYADAKWMDLARVRGMRRTHRIILVLDESTATVRPSDQLARYDWSAGADGANLNWVSERGIMFFQRDVGREFGLQIDAAGRLTPTLSYTYRFDVLEMKAPLIKAVTHAGWRWRPTALHGPRWLRWLTD